MGGLRKRGGSNRGVTQKRLATGTQGRRSRRGARDGSRLRGGFFLTARVGGSQISPERALLSQLMGFILELQERIRDPDLLK